MLLYPKKKGGGFFLDFFFNFQFSSFKFFSFFFFSFQGQGKARQSKARGWVGPWEKGEGKGGAFEAKTRKKKDPPPDPVNSRFFSLSFSSFLFVRLFPCSNYKLSYDFNPSSFIIYLFCHIFFSLSSFFFSFHLFRTFLCHFSLTSFPPPPQTPPKPPFSTGYLCCGGLGLPGVGGGGWRVGGKQPFLLSFFFFGFLVWFWWVWTKGLKTKKKEKN